MLNLPKGTTEREIRNMFAFAPGFLKCSMYDQTGNPKNKYPEGSLGAFVLFETPQAALQASQRLDGYVFDRENPSMAVACRIAMKNLMMGRHEEEQLTTLDFKRVRVGGGVHAHHGGYSEPQAYMDSGMPSSAAAFPQVHGVWGGSNFDTLNPSIAATPFQPPALVNQYDGVSNSYDQYAYAPQATAPAFHMGAVGRGGYGGSDYGGRSNYGGARRSAGGGGGGTGTNPPCDTLFLSAFELPELNRILAKHPSHTELKTMTDRKGAMVAFAQFTDGEAAGECMQAIKDSSSIRVGYSKNPLGKRS